MWLLWHSLPYVNVKTYLFSHNSYDAISKEKLSDLLKYRLLTPMLINIVAHMKPINCRCGYRTTFPCIVIIPGIIKAIENSVFTLGIPHHLIKYLSLSKGLSQQFCTWRSYCRLLLTANRLLMTKHTLLIE